MSKFNTTMPKAKTLTENLAGGQAYSQSNELALVSLLLTSFVNDQFYRNAQTTLDELRNLTAKVKDKEFVAKAAIFARDRFGMRSITHALAGELTSQLSGAEWGKNFYEKVITRVDDMTEIMSYYLNNKTWKICGNQSYFPGKTCMASGLVCIFASQMTSLVIFWFNESVLLSRDSTQLSGS